MAASKKSLLGLDYVNIFMADVKDGVGVYLSVYLLVVQKWDPSEIGLVTSIPFFLGILFQSPVGAFIDKTHHKRWLIFIASLLIALSCLLVIYFPTFKVIFFSQAMVGLVQTIFHPCVAGISLGMVGYELLPKRIGRNESFNHFGNMIGAVASGLIGWYISYEGVFYFSVFQCLAIIFAVKMIRENDIDHDLARSAHVNKWDRPTISKISSLFQDRRVLLFTFSMGLFHFANGSMLPLLGQKMGIKDIESSALYLSICIIIAQSVMTAVAPWAAKMAEGGRKTILLLAFLLIPVRAFFFAFLEDNIALMSLQVIDGIGAGIFGVVSILMMADLSRGSGHFNFLQGTVYAAMGLGIALSSVFSGYVVSNFGYAVGFTTLGVLGVFASLFFSVFVRETHDTLGMARFAHE